MGNSAIEVRSLAKRFSRKTVLKEVTLHVPAGKTYAFLGRNGAGKTTTIRTLLGLLDPDAGQLSVLGLNPKTKPWRCAGASDTWPKARQCSAGCAWQR
jgi:ABC-2 type transport system ATP-binding protein